VKLKRVTEVTTDDTVYGWAIEAISHGDQGVYLHMSYGETMGFGLLEEVEVDD